MKEHPILFRAPSVRAILNGSKCQTRRVITDHNSQGNYRASELLLDDELTFVDPGPSPAGNPGPYLHAPLDTEAILERRGVEQDPAVVERLYPRVFPGDLLWVRETHAWADWLIDGHELSDPNCVVYRADLSCLRHIGDHPISVHLGLEGDAPYNVDILRWRPSIHMPRWAARLLLSVVEIRAQRIQEISFSDIRAEGIECPEHDFPGGFCSSPCAALEEAFVTAWDAMNAKRGHPWRANDWVWAYTFSHLEESP